MRINKVNILLVFLYIFTCSNAQTIATGESSIFKKGNETKAYYEALTNAQQNALIVYGGNISSQSFDATVDVKQAEKLESDKEYTSSTNFGKVYQSIVNQSASASVKLEKVLKVDTIHITGRKYKIQLKGSFNISPTEAANTLGANFLSVGEKIKISVIENDCKGEVYQNLSNYLNYKNNNFLFSKDEWALQEEDFTIEISDKQIVLKNKHNLPNTIVKLYNYIGCADLATNNQHTNKTFDEILNDLYFLQLYFKSKKKK